MVQFWTVPAVTPAAAAGGLRKFTQDRLAYSEMQLTFQGSCRTVSHFLHFMGGETGLERLIICPTKIIASKQQSPAPALWEADSNTCFSGEDSPLRVRTAWHRAEWGLWHRAAEVLGSRRCAWAHLCRSLPGRGFTAAWPFLAAGAGLPWL